jgi:hypothetical protein
MNNAFTFDENLKGIFSLKDYPYIRRSHFLFGCSGYMERCKPEPNTKVVTVKDFAMSGEVLSALVRKPASIAISSATRFQIVWRWSFHDSLS